MDYRYFLNITSCNTKTAGDECGPCVLDNAEVDNFETFFKLNTS